MLFATLIDSMVPTPPSIPVGKCAIKVKAGAYEIELHTFKPSNYEKKRVIFVFHGVLRNAPEYRDHAEKLAERFGALVVAPYFDEVRFPSLKYQRGGLLNEARQAQPPSEWTYALIPQIAEEVRRIERSADLKYWFVGHSAGGQFLVRMSAFQATGAERIVAANPGSLLFPRRDEPFGYGFGDLPVELSSDERIRSYLAAPLTLYVGTSDNAEDENFDTSVEAMKQGSGRYQRSHACFAFAKNLAKRQGWAFNWKIVEAKGIGHDHEKMFDHPNCGLALFGRWVIGAI
jgi:dienelactone hydrolase